MAECHCGHCEVENAGQRLYARSQTPARAETPGTDHPWMDFLGARGRLIRFLADEGKSDREIAMLLSMSRVAQVTQLRLRPLPSSGV